MAGIVGEIEYAVLGPRRESAVGRGSKSSVGRVENLARAPLGGLDRPARGVGKRMEKRRRASERERNLDSLYSAVCVLHRLC